MKRTVLALFAAAVTATGLFSGTAAASGPAPPGKGTVEDTCEGLGPITVTVLRKNGNGAFQFVGQTGHGREVSFTLTLTDVTTGEEIFSEGVVRAGGNANHNQSTVACAVPFEGPASEFFGEGEPPPGVSPGDIVRFLFETQAVIKP